MQALQRRGTAHSTLALIDLLYYTALVNQYDPAMLTGAIMHLPTNLATLLSFILNLPLLKIAAAVFPKILFFICLFCREFFKKKRVQFFPHFFKATTYASQVSKFTLDIRMCPLYQCRITKIGSKYLIAKTKFKQIIH